MIELNSEEKKAIIALQRLARSWPKTLWLFCNGSMTILKCDRDGKRAHKGEGIDQDYAVGNADLPCDGGDW